MIVRILKVIVPFLLVVAGAYGAWRMIESRPEVETEVREQVVPLVRTLIVKKEDIRLSVISQGTVTAKVVTDLVPEVAGKVTYISPSLVVGGFFEKDETLLRIDPDDYELALIRAEAEVAQTTLRLEQERAEAAVAVKEWGELGKGEEASPLVLRIPQVAQAEAAVAGAEAALRQAKRDLERTDITASFVGRVRQKNVDIGQYVGRGQAVAQLYSVDVAEVRLPLPDEDLAFVKVPLSYRGENETPLDGPEVLLKARFAGSEHVWKGRIVRTEGEIDRSTRMIYVVAEVLDPYGHGKYPGRPPLAVGMFVEAEILGSWLKGAVALPRAAIRGTDQVYIVDAEGRLRFRTVDIFKNERERVVVKGGLEEGEAVCISPMETVVEGMKVRVADEEVSS
ncbi:MAG TPA: efflux RND transporter periplasmic adaptor subunit [Acidobacteriota bacterium]|nr:efflux RND transporter periplasmic adaptor subunit [Acidobacteriota bacterium]